MCADDWVLTVVRPQATPSWNLGPLRRGKKKRKEKEITLIMVLSIHTYTGTYNALSQLTDMLDSKKYQTDSPYDVREVECDFLFKLFLLHQ